ncbi:hypothetical protein BCD_1849 (plasmid) [Borrelia crocidurae DOU]|uniref:Uncharacterized protein n=1 Tax=Borrelia crocidurae DOU TaxID=1293575 RepID=W5SM39_9SPIR|nr:hypothetical protein BCD_1849 [Borrelia crocidurae DOU]
MDIKKIDTELLESKNRRKSIDKFGFPFILLYCYLL